MEEEGMKFDLCMDAVLVELNPRYCELIAKNCAQMTLF